MKDLLICVLAMTWALGLIWYLGRRRYQHERPAHIDRDFREMVARHDARCAYTVSDGINRAPWRCLLAPRHKGDHDTLGPIGDVHGARKD